MQSTGDTAPGLADTAAQAAAEYAAAMARSTAQQAQAARFVVERGAQVLGGHAPVTTGEVDR